jgi:hypothetical protein
MRFPFIRAIPICFASCFFSLIGPITAQEGLMPLRYNHPGLLVDFLLNSANADFLEQVGSVEGKWVMRNSGTLASKDIEGHDVFPTLVDFDSDKLPDFLGGAEDGHLCYFKNNR